MSAPRDVPAEERNALAAARRIVGRGADGLRAVAAELQEVLGRLPEPEPEVADRLLEIGEGLEDYPAFEARGYLEGFVADLSDLAEGLERVSRGLPPEDRS